MITVSGRTFDHRDTLKAMGGKWDNASKTWIFRTLTNLEKCKVRAMIGVTIVENAPPRVERSNSEIVREAEEYVERVLRSPPRVIGTNRTAVYGDDDQYLNHFKDQNPTAFFGFSSLQTFTDYVATLPIRDDHRGLGWDTTPRRREWFGTPDMSHALRLAREGWQGGLGDFPLEIPPATVRKRLKAVAGGAVSVGRMLSGDPAHMIRRPRQPGRKTVTLFVETFMSAGIDPDNAITRAQLVAAMCDNLERQGYICEIVAVTTTRASSGAGGVGHQAAITVKTAGERLNLLDIVFALGHPSFFRRMIFACVGAAEECTNTHRGQGSPTAAFDATHPCGRNEFYIKQLSLTDQQKIDDDPLSMLPFIKPKNLDI